MSVPKGTEVDRIGGMTDGSDLRLAARHLQKQMAKPCAFGRFKSEADGFLPSDAAGKAANMHCSDVLVQFPLIDRNALTSRYRSSLAPDFDHSDTRIDPSHQADAKNVFSETKVPFVKEAPIMASFLHKGRLPKWRKTVTPSSNSEASKLVVVTQPARHVACSLGSRRYPLVSLSRAIPKESLTGVIRTPIL